MSRTPRAWRRLASFAAALLVLGSLTAFLVLRSRSATGSRATFEAAYAAQDWKRSADLARERIKTDPNDLDALRYYARSMIRMGRDESGATIYNTRFTPETLEAEDRFVVGLSLVHLGENEKCLRVWELSADTDPDRPELLEQLTRLAFAMQRLDRSADCARRLAKLPGHEAQGLLLQAEIQNALENRQAAIDAATRGLELDPEAHGLPADSAHYRRLMIRNLLALGRANEAKVQLAKLPKLSTDSATDADLETHWLASRAELQLGDVKAASQALAAAGTYEADHPEKPEPSPYIGAERCTTCHKEIAQSYKSARHNRTFHRGEQLLDLHLPEKPLPDPSDPKITHTVVKKDKQLFVRTESAGKVTDMMIEYAFGTRDTYCTMVARDSDHNYRALRLSYYHTSEGTGWDHTSGDIGTTQSGDALLGQKISEQDTVHRCVACHTTNPYIFRDSIPASARGPEALDSAIGCERCHGPAANHVAAVEHDFSSMAIFNAGTKSTSISDRQCINCHIVGDTPEILRDPTNPAFVRSPGATFPFSRCFIESNGALSCLTCHNPHADSNTTAAFQEGKCLNCHSSQTTTALAKTTTPAKSNRHDQPVKGSTCPVNPTKGCLECHMPKVRVPDLHMSLSDHFIRVRTHDPARPKTASNSTQ